MTTTWIENLKPGDEVYVVSGGGLGTTSTLRRVARMTPTQVLVEGHDPQHPWRYRRRDGCLVGGGMWLSEFIVQATPEMRAEVALKRRRQHAKRVIREANWSRLSDDALFHCAEIIEKAAADADLGTNKASVQP